MNHNLKNNNNDLITSKRKRKQKKQTNRHTLNFLEMNKKHKMYIFVYVFFLSILSLYAYKNINEMQEL